MYDNAMTLIARYIESFLSFFIYITNRIKFYEQLYRVLIDYEDTGEHDFTVPALPISSFIPLRPSHFSGRRFAPDRTQTINFIDTQRSTIKRQNHKTRVLCACAIKDSSKLYFYSYSGLHSRRLRGSVN